MGRQRKFTCVQRKRGRKTKKKLSWMVCLAKTLNKLEKQTSCACVSWKDKENYSMRQVLTKTKHCARGLAKI